MRRGDRIGALVVACAAASLLSLAAGAQPATKVPKPCAAARNRVAQQQQAIDDIDVRLQRERNARDACGTQKSCGRYHNRIDALEKRKTDYSMRLDRLHLAELKACNVR